MSVSPVPLPVFTVSPARGNAIRRLFTLRPTEPWIVEAKAPAVPGPGGGGAPADHRLAELFLEADHAWDEASGSWRSSARLYAAPIEPWLGAPRPGVTPVSVNLFDTAWDVPVEVYQVLEERAIAQTRPAARLTVAEFDELGRQVWEPTGTGPAFRFIPQERTGYSRKITAVPVEPLEAAFSARFVHADIPRSARRLARVSEVQVTQRWSEARSRWLYHSRIRARLIDPRTE